MKLTRSTHQAADYLRKAVPLMVKYNIPPNPLNYALWYTYVSQEVPALNERLDQALNTYGTCPGVVSEQMFREHIISSELEAVETLESNMLQVVNRLNTQANDTARHTEDYSTVLQDSLDAFVDNCDDKPLEDIIRQLAASTQAVNETTRAFQQQLDEAQTEIENLRNELQQSRQDAHIDPLTGLFNRRVFDGELEQLIETKQSSQMSLVMIDVDHFKHFNDTYGHLMGDKVLQYVGKLLQDYCQPPVLAARFGGEEFVVMLPDRGIQAAAELAETLRSKIQAIRIRQRRSGDIISSISASFGVSQWQPRQSADELIESADHALYRAKENGRNRVECG